MAVYCARHRELVDSLSCVTRITLLFMVLECLCRSHLWPGRSYCCILCEAQGAG